jgi:hypothetical protein
MRRKGVGKKKRGREEKEKKRGREEKEKKRGRESFSQDF